MNEKQLLIKILLKKAKGYAYHEKTDEFSVVDGKKVLTKRKVVTKRVQPDVNAIKALIAISDDAADVTEMTDEQLQVEKMRLLTLLNDYENSSPPPQNTQTCSDEEI